MKTTEIKCDACGSDLSDAGAMPTYALELSAFGVRNSGNIMYDVAVSPDIRRPYHFCGLGCLDHWRGREKHEQALWAVWWADWKDKHGSKSADGRFSSYPSPPNELMEAQKKAIKAAAMEAFPMKRVAAPRS